MVNYKALGIVFAVIGGLLLLFNVVGFTKVAKEITSRRRVLKRRGPGALVQPAATLAKARTNRIVGIILGATLLLLGILFLVLDAIK